MIDLASFGYGLFAGAALLSAGEWIWYHFAPMDRTRDAYELAKKRRK